MVNRSGDKVILLSLENTYHIPEEKSEDHWKNEIKIESFEEAGKVDFSGR